MCVVIVLFIGCAVCVLCWVRRGKLKERKRGRSTRERRLHVCSVLFTHALSLITKCYPSINRTFPGAEDNEHGEEEFEFNFYVTVEGGMDFR